MAGQRQVGLDGDAAGPVDARAPVSSPSSPASGEAATPAAQMTVRAARRSGAPSASSTVTPLGVDVGDRVADERRRRRAARASATAFAESDGGKLVSTRSAASTSRMRAVRGSIARKSRRSVSRASSAIWPAISTPVGPAPTTTNVSQVRPPLRVVLGLGRLERGAGSGCAPTSALSSDFTSAAYSLPVVVAEVGVPRAAGDDRACRTGRDAGAGTSADRAEPHLALLEVEAGDLGEHDAHVRARA